MPRFKLIVHTGHTDDAPSHGSPSGRKDSPVSGLPLTGESFSVTVENGTSIRDLVRRCKFDFVKNEHSILSDFTKRRFAGKSYVTVEFCELQGVHGYNNIILELAGRDYRPATLREMLCFALAHPLEQMRHPIYVIGTKLKDPFNFHSSAIYVAYLTGWGSAGRTIGVSPATVLNQAGGKYGHLENASIGVVKN